MKDTNNDNEQKTWGELFEELKTERTNLAKEYMTEPMPIEALRKLERIVRCETKLLYGLPTMVIYDDINETPAERKVRALGEMKQELLNRKGNDGELSFQDRRSLKMVQQLEQKAIQDDL